MIASNRQGWRTTKQIEDLIVRKSGGISLYPHLQAHAQMGIQTEGTYKSTCKNSI